MDHVSVGGHTPKTALTAQTGLDELKKKNHEVEQIGKGEEVWEELGKGNI